MSNLNEEDIAKMMEDTNSSTEPVVEIFDVYFRNIKIDLVEWDKLLNWLSKSNRRIYEIKEEYKLESDKILAEARRIKEDPEDGRDIIKEKYGGNNDKTRKKYVEEQLVDLINEKRELEFHVVEDGRRIAFLKELIRTKRMLKMVKE